MEPGKFLFRFSIICQEICKKNRIFVKGNKVWDNFWYNKLCEQICMTNKILEQDVELCKKMSRELHKIEEQVQNLGLKSLEEMGYKDIDDYKKRRKEFLIAKMENAPNEESRKEWADLLGKHNKEYP